MQIGKFLIVASAAVGLAFSPMGGATAQAATVAELLTQVETLMTQIAELQGKLKEARGELTELLTSDLALGMTSDEVKQLQELLASDPSIYPQGLITGYYGPMTAAAVAKLQQRFGIDSIGRVGPETRKLINEIFKGHGKNLKALKFENGDDNGIDLSEFVPGMTGVKLCHRTGSGKSHTIAVGGPAVKAHIAHGDTIGACDDDEDEDELTDEEKAEEAIEDAQSAITEAEEAIEDSEGDTSDAEELLEDAKQKLEEAEDAFDEEEWEEAEELAEDAEELAKDAEDALPEDEEDFDVEVEVETEGDTTTTTVSFTFEEDDYEVEVDGSDEDGVLEAVADELDVDVEDLDEDLADEIADELADALD